MFGGLKFPIFVKATTVVCLLMVAACQPEEVAEIPKPIDLTLDATGHFCNMTILDHPGPKAQVFVKGGTAPFWFTSARDAIAFSLLPESARMVSVMYVTDMATVSDWTNTTNGKWIDARKAFYVIGSAKKGGMGATEAVPFGNQASAQDFAISHGGEVVSFGDVPRSYVLDASQTSSLESE